VVGIPVNERVCVTDCVFVNDVVIDLVNGNVVGIPDVDTVCVIDTVNGLLVATALGDLE